MNAFARVDKETFYRFMATRREGRYEYVRGRIVQQTTGGTRDHGLMERRIARMIDDQVDQGRAWPRSTIISSPALGTRRKW